jgi:Acetyltransferase (GNAT) domain
MTSVVETLPLARSAGVEPLRSPRPGDYSLQVLRGFDAIRKAAAQIAELRELTGQGNNPLLRLEFFLGRVRLFPGNLPVVLLLRSAQSLEGVVYLYEKTLCGLPTGYLRGFDHLTGESCVIAHAPSRAVLLKLALHQLFVETNARVAWATVCQGSVEPMVNSHLARNALRLETSSIVREHCLKLSGTFAATLGRFGQHTRRNLRYYRRRAERELNVTFHPNLSAEESGQALQQLSQSSFQPFPDSLSEWGKMAGLLQSQPGYFAMGLRADGEWISYLVGMRTAGLTWVLMQMNHNRYARHSLSTVLRSYFFEHEIERGQIEIKFVNGTCALFQRCCEADTCWTVLARRGPIAFLIARCIAPWHSAPDHALNMPRWAPKLRSTESTLP